MTPKEYKSKLEALKRQETELAQEFVKDNPFKDLEGKLVNITIGCSQKIVLFNGAGFAKDFTGKPGELALFFHRLNKDGTPRKNAEKILVEYFDEKLHKIERLCRR